MSIGRTIAQVFSARMLGAVTVFIGFAVFARLLTASVFGVFLLFFAVSSLINSVIDLGIGNALEKRMSGNVSNQGSIDFLSTAISMKLVIFVPIAGLLFVARELLNSYIGAELALLLIPVVFFQQLGWTCLNAIKGTLQVDLAEYLGFVQKLLFIFVGVLLVYLGGGIMSLVVGLITSWAVVMVIGIYLVREYFGVPTIEGAISLGTFAKFDFIPSVLRESLYSWMDLLIIGYFLTSQHVAAYEMAWRVGSVVMLLSYSISLTIFPNVSHWLGQDMLEEVEKLIPNMMMMSLLFVIPASVGSIIFSGEILELVFGSGYVIAEVALIILLFGRIPEAINHIFIPTLRGMNEPKLVTYSASVFILLNISLNILLVRVIGINGAAVATSVSLLVFVFHNYIYLTRFLAVKIPIRSIAVLCSAAIFTSCTAWIFKMVFSPLSLVSLSVIIIVAGIIYIGLLSIPRQFRQKFYYHLLAD